MIRLRSERRGSAEPSSWQRVLREAIRDLDELARLLEIPATELKAVAESNPRFPLLVPRGFVARMRRNDLHDPLLKQVLTLTQERERVDGFGDDPLDERAVALDGVLQKYPGRALLIASGACPVHCRYCFRRAFPYQAQLAARDDFSGAVESLRASPGVKEVILSGGDPLSLGNQKLRRLIGALGELPSVETLRIHTRFPVMIPERIDAGLLELLGGVSLNTVVVIHANHPHELDDKVETALHALAQAVGFVLNQSVLLRGINDDVETLAGLSNRLFTCAVLPYYLHLLDPVAGAAHFAVEDSEALQLLARLRQRLPGYLVPRLVREVPGELSKTAMDLAAPTSSCDLRTIGR